MKVGMISLGCPKNQVSAEQMLFLLREAGHEITTDMDEAEAIVVNTCAFIEDAKQEAINTVLEAAVARMVEYGFVNDENYAAMVARHYAAKGCGPARIREELRRRRLDRELWDAALDAAPENSEAAYRLFAAKMRGGCDKDAVRKASAALVRRGFSWEDVRAAAERYLSEMENT